MNNNFTFSDLWINALYIRYDINKLKKYDNIYFYENDNLLKCQHFFYYDLSEDILNCLKFELNSKKIKFSYIDNEQMINKLKLLCKENGFKFELEDTWEAPILELNESLNNYINKIKSSQIKKNYKYYLIHKENFILKKSNNKNIINLWKDVLKIDNNSWKKNEKSDMKNLDREDLQYLPFLINNEENTSLFVLYDKNNNPISYSLMFKINDEWYQSKWGASNDGRKFKAGFIILFSHIEYLYNLKKYLQLDFWGRRNKTYDNLKNGHKIRSNILISKE